ncbi:unnamed protein product [Aphanomyces euteiches]|uniref:Uncharacterized protein n=1 Tax=Aphanomyces euteiches TaxID=100861 RepID=A0A6G0XU28_9STRA|nr:hypothetical protein Ae201684_001574 [Aphanomyces euteiches]KAH9075307.1 hypothetical protein Ae201684P_003988 [Aphanomyces euteiches]KAH9144998.1 hypothetical protein AeRB84_011086 [Aphanomyces euteiches]
MEFATAFREKEELNQYWYSQQTIQYLALEILRQTPTAVAFLSTPTLFYACEDLSKKTQDAGAARAELVLFDYDAALPRVVHYDFHEPTNVSPGFEHHFDFVVIDPPFITEEVWTKYAMSARYLLAPHGKLLLTTIAENASLMERLLGCTLRRFQPSIPHLVYQYGTYANYESEALDQVNPEIPQDD